MPWPQPLSGTFQRDNEAPIYLSHLRVDTPDEEVKAREARGGIKITTIIEVVFNGCKLQKHQEKTDYYWQL